MASFAFDFDVQLMCRVRDGDANSFAVLTERHRTAVVHFLYRMVQNQAVAEELAQEVFLRVYRSRMTYAPSAKFTTWLFRIATHLALNWLRDGRFERNRESLDGDTFGGSIRQVPDRNPTAEQSLLAGVRIQEIRDAIGRLSTNQKTAVIMHKYQEMDYSQIAGVLNCSESAVKSLLFRAYERLRAQLAHLAA
ncbi:MAG: RNA polymerase sigma factor [Bryobacteraceae bacterium]